MHRRQGWSASGTLAVGAGVEALRVQCRPGWGAAEALTVVATVEGLQGERRPGWDAMDTLAVDVAVVRLQEQQTPDWGAVDALPFSCSRGVTTGLAEASLGCRCFTFGCSGGSDYTISRGQAGVQQRLRLQV